MKIIAEMYDNFIESKYELCLYTFNELKNIIIENSGLTERELSYKFDSNTNEILETKEEYLNRNYDTILSFETIETIDYIKNFLTREYQSKKLKLSDLKKYKKNNYQNSFIDKIKDMTNEEVDFSIKSLTEELNESKTLKKFILNNNNYEHFKSIENILTNDFALDFLKTGTINMHFTNDTDSTYFSSNLSRRLFFDYDKLLRDAKKSEKELEYKLNSAKKAMENYNFCIEESKGKIVLLDGFNRLFGSSFESDNKEIIVKKYVDLSELQYSYLIYNLNDWKLKGSVRTRYNFTKDFLDRGVRASLFIKYGINDINLNALKVLNKNNNLIEVLQFFKELDTYIEEQGSNITFNMIDFINSCAVIFANQLEYVDLDTLLSIVNELKPSDIVKINNFTSKTFVERFAKEYLLNRLEQYRKKEGC